MAARWPFWKWHSWKSIDFFPYTQVMCQWSLDLIFIGRLKLESGNWKIQYGHQAAILKVTSLKINRLLPIPTNNMHMKFGIEIPKKTWVTLRKPCRLQTDGQTDRRTRWIQYTPPPPSSIMCCGILLREFHSQCQSYESVWLVWKLYFKITARAPRTQWVKDALGPPDCARIWSHLSWPFDGPD